MNIIHEHVCNPFPEYLKDAYERIDEKLCVGMDWAETNCRKLCMGVIPWSPTYLKKI